MSTKPTKEPQVVELSDDDRAKVAAQQAAADLTLTPAQREAFEQLRAKTRSELDAKEAEKAAAMPAEQYVGRSPAQIEEEEARQDAAAHDPDTSSAAERRIKSLEDQLRETNELVKKLAADKGGYSAVSREVVKMEKERKRRVIYDRIIKNGGLCTVILHTHEDPKQNWPVWVGVNGRGVFIKRGEPTVITAGQLEVLDHAEYEYTVNEVGDDGSPRPVHHERLSYPYSLLDYTGQRLEAIA